MKTELGKEQSHHIFSLITDSSFAKDFMWIIQLRAEKLVLSVQGFQTKVWHINYT